MEVNVFVNPFRRFWFNSIKFIRSPMTRLRKLARKLNLRQMKTRVYILLILTCIATAVTYYLYNTYLKNYKYKYTEEMPRTTTTRNYNTPFHHVPLNVAYKDVVTEEDDMFGMEEYRQANMVDTPGCKIPVVLVNYKKYTNNNTRKKISCGTRAVFVRKYDDHSVQAFIKTSAIQKYMQNKSMNYECCYQFIDKQSSIYPRCIKFKDNDKIPLQSDFLNIKCLEYTDQNETYSIYDDIYAFAKKINLPKSKEPKCDTKYNVLLIGMDSMSLPRAIQTLPRTVDYFRNDYWTCYRGYHKIAENTFPNLIAAFTGKNMTTVKKECFRNMDKCNPLMVWSKFKEIGYVTAYGEDHRTLPDTFSSGFEFKQPPTDHYMRPFFVKREYMRNNSMFLCAGKACSGQQVLDYALDFANTYKRESFFGVFWINSFSQSPSSHPYAADKIVENFFIQLAYTGALKNTFVIFFSDHGIRFGRTRLSMESYYDERMPMFFMWVPPYFKSTQSTELRAVATNQHSLITPYDIYSTLLHIKSISQCSNLTDGPPEGCPNCHSTFKLVSRNRTCEDVSIHPKWCCCHKLYPLPAEDTEGSKGVDLALNHINSLSSELKTWKCWRCSTFKLKKILRIHFYYDKDIIGLFYVVAFMVNSGITKSFEATVYRKYDKWTIVGPVSDIMGYSEHGSCAINTRTRQYCMCKKVDNCSDGL